MGTSWRVSHRCIIVSFGSRGRGVGALRLGCIRRCYREPSSPALAVMPLTLVTYERAKNVAIEVVAVAKGEEEGCKDTDADDESSVGGEGGRAHTWADTRCDG